MKKIILFHQGADEYGSDKIFELISVYLSKDHKVKVVLDCTGPLVNKLIEYGVEDVEILNLAVLRKVNIGSFKKLLSFTSEFVKATLEIRKVIKSFEPDVIYVNTLAVVSPLIASIGIKAYRVHHLHEIQNNPRFIFQALYSISGMFSDRVICVSNAVIDCFQSLSLIGKDKAKLVYNGLHDFEAEIDSSFEKSVTNEFKNPELPIVAYVARVHSWKGQLEFLDAIHELLYTHKVKANFVFFGDVFPGYEYLNEDITKKIKLLKLENNVKFFGFRKDADKLFALSILSVMGSIEPDPLPTIVLESMRQSTPVVAYAHGGSLEMISDKQTGLLVPPRDIQKMSLALKYLITNPHEAHKLGLSARDAFIQKFSLIRFQKQIYNEMGLDSEK